MTNVERFGRMLSNMGIEMGIVTNPINILYLSGYKPDSPKGVEVGNFGDPFGVLVLYSNSLKPTLLLDQRYEGVQFDGIENVEVLIIKKEEGKKFLDQTLDFLLSRVEKSEEAKKTIGIGIEEDFLRMSEGNKILSILKNQRKDGREYKVDDISSFVRELRVSKTDEEISLLKQATTITDKIFSEIIKEIKPGKTEREIAEIINKMIDQNGCTQSFGTIVAAGPNSAIPHHTPTEYVFKERDIVLMDFGACYKGYHGDMTRIVFIGEPTEKQKNVYEAVLGALREAVYSIKAGMKEGDIYYIALQALEKYGYGQFFTHGLGHGIGLNIHEAPSLKIGFDGNLVAGSVITIEPGVYLPGEFGIRIEDAIVLTDNGAETITTSVKEILVI